MLVKLECRIPKNIKQRIIDKTTASNISISEFIRTIFDDIEDLNQIEYKNISKNMLYDDKIRFKLSDEKIKLINQICIHNQCNISQLIRAFLETENYIINQFEYLTLCEFEITRVGTILNKIAHELNRKNLLLDLSNESYEIVIARLIEPIFIINNVISLLSNPPLFSDDISNSKFIYQKKTQLRWAAKIYRITNNIRQIIRRIIIDYKDDIILKNTYDILLLRINELESKFKEIFVCLKIFRKIINNSFFEITDVNSR
ncbi:MAG: hypothetical protein K2Q03_01545 [Sphingobacteriaceae bacterium]|nr:hypothetical protein [Sphingobacteriaceae bacterium]